jgi:hypothetical protein
MKIWLSCPIFTVQVNVDCNMIITSAAPIVTRFIGQPYLNLWNWARRSGPAKEIVLK